MTRTIIATEFKQIKKLINTKPCDSLEHYRAEVDTGYGDCPLLNVCFNRKALVDTLSRAMDGNVNLPLVQFQPKPKKEKK
jgi:hypothetical protein